MKHEISDPLTYDDTPAQKPPLQDVPVPHYFDGTGLLWILACVAFALAVAHFLPWDGPSERPLAASTAQALPRPL